MKRHISGNSGVTWLLLLLLCLQLPYTHSFKSLNSTLLRVKRQDCGFTCDNGDCISSDNVCDGTTECADGSDETAEKCSGVTCASFLFRCAYGPCINKNKVCNGVKDCADNSDETGPGCGTGSSSCSPTEFRCNNGQCIDDLLVCDGKKDCTDGSDETKEKCGGISCAPFLYQCAYGPCVDRNARCNRVQDCADGSDELGCFGNVTPPIPTPTPPTPPTGRPPTPTGGGCVLPNHPPNGQLMFLTGATYIPNTVAVKNSAIKIQCNGGYKADKQPNGGVTYCLDGVWFGDTVTGHVCKRTCPPLIDPTIESKCFLGNDVVSCSEAVEGVTAQTKCASFFTYGTSRSRMYCRNGAWEPNLGSCVPECGVKRVEAQTLTIGGSRTTPGEYPWIVAVYRNNGHICGGSIISRIYVLSAAHCFTDPDSGEPYNKDEYVVIAGKYYREVNDNRDTGTQQIRTIDQIIIHEYYRGRLQNYQYDIALLVVKEFKLDFNVEPVCVDWTQQFEEISLTNGNKGVVAGWGFTAEGGNPAEELKKIVVPIHDKITCKEHLPKDFYQTYYTPDKLCAGYYNNATNVCSGDSGGGYYFQSDRIFYIRAIVSLSPPSKVGCNKDLYALYTKISLYNNWLESVTGKFI